MGTFAIPNRPFATEPFTSLMTPDGIFEIALGQQTLNAHVQATVATSGAQVYVESVDDPGIVISSATYNFAPTAAGGSQLFSWQANFAAATPGKHLVSFIVQRNGIRERIIQRIFVTRIAFDPATSSFSVTTPEGVLKVGFKEMLGPKDGCCCGDKRRLRSADVGARDALLEVSATAGALQLRSVSSASLVSYLSEGFRLHGDPGFVLCTPQVLPKVLEAELVPTPPFTGQYGDLPFQDPWWKIALAILAFLLLVAAAIAEAVGGNGDITVGAGGTTDVPSGTGGSCCAPTAEGGGTSGVAAGLVAAAATVATIAAASDVRDPFRKGQDHTQPASANEQTVGESLRASFSYTDAIAPGKPFQVGLEYEYTRITTAQTYSYTASESNANVHLLDHYVIDAPDVVRAYKREPWVVKAEFFDANNELFGGDQLFVQCFLIGPAGELRTFGLQDHGVSPDSDANDGTYTGRTFFTVHDKGLWKYFVLAQDINNADPALTPEQAAQIIGGMLLTDQLQISFEGGTCPLVPDGDVNVIA